MMYKREEIVKNFFWRLLERVAAQGVSFIVSLIIAKALSPKIYGEIAIITVITSIFQVFVDSGLSTALIQKKEVDNIDYSTVFYFNLLVCVLLYIVIYIVAPKVALFYKMPNLTKPLRALGILLIISGFKNIQIAFISRNLHFKKYFLANFVGIVVSAIVGICMAYSGYGIWSLIVQNLVNQIVDTAILWIINGWHPALIFSYTRLKVLYKYGSRLLISSLIETIYSQLNQLIIGKIYASENLAYYNKGHEIPMYIAIAINSSIDSVLLPVMSSNQDDRTKVKNMTRRAIKTSSFFIWPVMMGLAGCSVSFVQFFLTEEWLPMIPYLIIFCFTFSFYPIHAANLNAIKALGYSDIYLKLEIVKKIYGIIILIIAMRFGPFGMALSTIISSILGQIINSFPNRKLLNYTYLEQLKDIFPSILLSICMGMTVFVLNMLYILPIYKLLLQILFGIIMYIIGSIIFKIDTYNDCLKIIKKLILEFQHSLYKNK